MNSERFDKILIGAGLYGLYAALFCCKKGQRVVVLDRESGPFRRATYANQARVHQGYHYPRSISTAMKSAGYFERFNRDFDFCINREFDMIYATSGRFSWTDGKQFKEFCKAAEIPCDELNQDNYFQKGMCDGAFRTREYTYDAEILREFLTDRLKEHEKAVRLEFGVNITGIERTQDSYIINTENRGSFESGYVLNATYAGTNQILELAGFEKFKIKYELCEVILCDVNETLKNSGFTVMDGPFFSIMPFGRTGLHSLTSVAFTPHTVSYDELPDFQCSRSSAGRCTKLRLGNCNECPAKPETAFAYMSGLAGKYLQDKYEFSYNRSMFSIKPILLSSEIDDSRPTVIRRYSSDPVFVGVLTGKINTVYDLDDVL